MAESIREKKEIERSEARDKTARIITGLIPGGGSVYDTFTAIVQPLHVRRRDEWIKEVTLRLHKLEQEKRINLAELAENEEFITVITRATLLAIQTHQQEKKNAFKNIVTETSLYITADDLDFDEMNAMLTILERLNSLHIYLLTMIENLRERAENSGIEVGKDSNDLVAGIVFELDETLKEKKEIVNLCWVDLFNGGLVFQSSQKGASDIEYGSNPRLTPIGLKLLELIRK